jgi:prepilin-type processing-associated H-X9-DG protein
LIDKVTRRSAGIRGNNKIFYCPASPTPWTSYTAWSIGYNDDGSTCYPYKRSYAIAAPATYAAAADRWKFFIDQYHKTSELEDAAGTLYIGEQVDDTATSISNGGTRQRSAAGDGYTDSYYPGGSATATHIPYNTTRHGNGSMWLFLDGHVAFIPGTVDGDNVQVSVGSGTMMNPLGPWTIVKGD